MSCRIERGKPQCLTLSILLLRDMHPIVFSKEYLCPPYSPFPTLARLWEGFVEDTRSRVVLVVLVVQVVLLNCVELVVRGVSGR